MTDPRHVTRADIYKSGQLAARLTRLNGGTRFEYLDHYSGPQIAHTLPLGESVTSVGVPAFFAGLLPEGRRLAALQRQAKVAADDDFTLLLLIGSDTIGDVTVYPEGADPIRAEAACSVDLTQISFAKLLSESGFVDRRGIPGVQEKASTGMITFPLLTGPENAGPAILKLNPPDWPFVVENESYFLALARRLKIPVVESQLVQDRDGQSGLLVKRFDRQLVDGQLKSLAVEDAIQLLGKYPADKHSVSAEIASTAITQRCAAALAASRNIFAQFVLAWLTGNGDLHGKNLAILQHPTGEWRPAPSYDIPSTLPYGDHTMALPLADRVQGLTRKRFLEFSKSLKLPAASAESTINQVLTATSPLLGDLEEGLLPWNREKRRQLIRQLGRRRQDLT